MNRQPWTPRDVDDLLHGREGSDPELEQLVQQLRAGRRLPAPVGALAQVLAGDLAVSDLPTDLAAYPVPAARRTRTGLGKARALVVAAVAVGSLLTGAAAANALPESAQRAAATVLNAVTPFSFPVPQQRPATPTGPEVHGTPTPQATATEDPTEDPIVEPTQRPTSKTGHGGTLRTGHTEPSDEPSDNPKAGTPSGDTGGDGTGDGTGDGMGDGQPTTRATAPATSGDGSAPEPDGQDTPATRPSGGPSDGASDRISQGTSDGGSESSSGTASGSGPSDGSGTGG